MEYVHDVQLRKVVGSLALDVSFTLQAPWTVLFAPSGAGKSTVLRMIAGLDRPHFGRIVSRGARVAPGAKDEILTDTRRGIFVPAHRRGIRMVMQSPALFPHLSVSRNISYGMDSRDGTWASQLQAISELCRVDCLRDKMPAQLSGGESQRVALARAVAATGYRLLLLDEPFTGLEAELRDAIIGDLRKHMLRDGIPVLQVTHDLGEVFSAEAEVLRMEGGRIVAQGSAGEVLAREREALLARLQR